MPTAALTASLTYTPPGGASNSAQAALSVSPSYLVLSIALLDIPGASASATVFAIPFGSIAKAKMVIVKNNNEQAMGVRFNSAIADEFDMAANGGEIIIANPADPGSGYLTAVDVVTTTTQSATAGQVESFVFGDE